MPVSGSGDLPVHSPGGRRMGSSVLAARLPKGGRNMSALQSATNFHLQPGDPETVTESLTSVDVYAEGVMVIPMPSFPLETLRKIRPDQPRTSPGQPRTS